MLKNLPFVSVIIPVFNDQTGIEKAINSILVQTYPKERFEIIVVDNGSTDRTRETVKKVKDVKLYIADQKKGPSIARNMGIKKAAGEIIAFTDSDCVADGNWLLEAMRLLKNENIGGVAGKIEFVYKKNKPNIYETVDSVRYFDQEEYVRQGYGATANLFVKKRLLENNLFNESLFPGEDYELCKKIFKKNSDLEYGQKAIIRHPARSTFKALREKTIRNGIAIKKLRKEGKIKRENVAWVHIRPKIFYLENDLCKSLGIIEKLKVSLIYNYLHYSSLFHQYL